MSARPGHGAGFSRTSIEAAWRSKPSARAIGAPARASAAGRGADADLAHAPAEVARAELRGEARRAAGRQRVVRARDVVAERGARSRARRTRAGAAHARRERLGVGADELEVLGREGLGEGQRGLEVGGVDERRGRVARVEVDRVEQRRRRRCTAQTIVPAPCSAWAARSMRTSAGSAPAAGQHEHVAGPGEAVDPDVAARPAAWPPARRGCRGRR